MADDVPTSTITVVEANHGRMRRRQRGIDKKDLQSAIKYGERFSTHPRPNGDETAIYKYKKITYIVNEVTKAEVTAYSEPLTLDLVPITYGLQKQHLDAQAIIQSNSEIPWTSNTVLVVDTSGSMRTSDVWGTRTRLGAVWVSLALDFIAHRLENGDAGPLDVVSVVSLGPTPSVIVEESPCTWILYNEIVRIYNEDLVPARGHGPFLPCLDVAERLLTKHHNQDSCAMALLFLSDGIPSDHIQRGRTKEDWCSAIVSRIESLAERFGRQLTFTAIGIGDYESFQTLEDMVEAAKDLDVFTSVATSITSTQTERTDVETLKQKKVRSYRRESRKKASEDIQYVSPDDFYIYHAKSQVIRKIYREWFDDEKRIRYAFEETALQCPQAEYVAMSNASFGEGAERCAFRFFEVASDRTTILGRPLVAKESRLILADDGVGDEQARKQFVRTFCKTQQLARRLASEFNEKMDQTRRIHPDTPRVTFLDCSIYELIDKKMGKLSVLVEEKLDHTKWHKWNSNNGYVEGMKHALVAKFDLPIVSPADLGAIEEGSEDEDDSSDGELFTPAQTQPILFSASEVAQAFSHFTYQTTGRKRLVCDLQGVFDENANVLRFSDPVIHYHNPERSDRRCVHGQTDRGEKGVRLFFDSHNDGHHGHLCKLVLRGFRRAQPHRRVNQDRRGFASRVVLPL